jgi:hypothetical protein
MGRQIGTLIMKNSPHVDAGQPLQLSASGMRASLGDLERRLGEAEARRADLVERRNDPHLSADALIKIHGDLGTVGGEIQVLQASLQTGIRNCENLRKAEELAALEQEAAEAALLMDELRAWRLRLHDTHTAVIEVAVAIGEIETRIAASNSKLRRAGRDDLLIKVVDAYDAAQSDVSASLPRNAIAAVKAILRHGFRSPQRLDQQGRIANYGRILV